MGALTLKSLAFYLRNWDTEKTESIDPTDGFGSNTRVYVSNNQIVQIEPEYNVYTFNTWLTDKGRQFFDGIFNVSLENNKRQIPEDSWLNIVKTLTQILYLNDLCNLQKRKTKFFTIVFENISVEILSFLVIMSQNYSFINLKRAENLHINNDLESNYQLNITSNNRIKLTNSTICLLVSTNPRYEGYFLNLNLRQRFFKGNFKCLSIGSLINLTFPVVFLGSNTLTLKNIAEGTHLVCQNLKSSKNPLVIYNNELLKRLDSNSLIESLKILKYANLFSKTWNNLNGFSSTLQETGTQSMAKFLPFNKTDLTDFSTLYFINVNTNNNSNLKQLLNFKLLNYYFKELKNPKLLHFFLDQSNSSYKNLEFYNNACLSDQKAVKYSFLPTSTFYENEEIFINTEGLVKKTVKVVFRKKTKNNWQLLRKFFKFIKNNLNLVLNKDNQMLFFNSKNISTFKNFIYFNYQAAQSLSNLNFYLVVKTQTFTIIDQNFKPKVQKILNTKMKYWLDDFYSGGKDGYSQNSLVLANCSKILRTKSTNFF